MNRERYIKIVGVEIVIASVCLGILSVRAPCAQSASSEASAESTPQVLAKYSKPLPGSELNRGNITVEWRQGKISVNAEEAPLTRVLQEISAQTGIDFLNLDKLRGHISVHFSNVPLHVGLQMLLSDMDYGVIGWPEDPSGMRIVIFEPTLRESANATSPPHQDDPQSPFQDEDLGPNTDLSILGQALGDKDPVTKEAAIQALAERGESEAMDLLRQAFRQSDSASKMMVIETVGSTPAALPLLREASQDSDPSVREAALAAISE